MNKISLREKLGYGVGAIGLDLSYGMFYSYLSIYLTDALKTRLHYLLKGERTLGYTVNVFIVVHLANAALALRAVFDDRQCHVGLERHKRAADVGEGDYMIGYEKALVSDV